MRITCLITVCAYLSSTVSTDEIQYLNKQGDFRLKRTRSQRESILDNVTARKELNPNPGISPNVFSTLQKSRPQRQIKTIQKVHDSQSTPQQHSRDPSRRPVKRLKIRSIPGSTYEVDDNEVHEFIHESIPEVVDESPIYIKPVVRVTTKKGILGSLLEILDQLLNPPRKNLGPIVGPIQMPGTKRKIYLRLLEPVDESHINVRFVTQVPVPVIDEDTLNQKPESFLPFLSLANPATTLLNRHPVESSDVTFSSSNRHHSVQLPRNASHASGKSQFKPATEPKRPPEYLKKTSEKKNTLPVKVEVTSGAESDKNQLYYQYQSEDDAVKQVTEIINDATKNEQGSKDSLEPWYQLSTHHLPLRQIAPIYPLLTMEHTDGGSYENTYKVPSDNLIAPSPQSSSYEQYSNANPAPGVYDQSYTIPNTYLTTYQKQNEFSNAPSSYPISYQNQNEFNNAPSSTSYVKQNDLFNAPTTYTSSYEKPADVPPLSSSYATPHEAQNSQTGSSSQNALRVIDPPAYFLDPRQVSKSHANKVTPFEHTTIQQQHINLPNVNEISSLPRHTVENGDVTWGKVKREKSELDFQRNESNFQKNESNFQRSEEIISNDNREKWQPLTFLPENWHKAFANLSKIADSNHHETVATTRQQSVNRSRQVSRNTTPSTIETGRVENHENAKRRKPSVATIRHSNCSLSNKRDRCERTESTVVSMPHPEGINKIVKEQIQSAASIEPVLITPKSTTSNTVEILRSNVTLKTSWIEEPQALIMTTESLATNSTTERSPLLIKMIKNTTEKSIKKKTTLSGSMSNLTEKSIASGTSERSSISSTSEVPVPKSTTKRLQLPKRPMLMKKPTFVLKKTESDRIVANITTWKPTTSSTMEKTKITRRSKYRSAALNTKSSTT